MQACFRLRVLFGGDEAAAGAAVKLPEMEESLTVEVVGLVCWKSKGDQRSMQSVAPLDTY